jgi:hypothetical protein
MEVFHLSSQRYRKKRGATRAISCIIPVVFHAVVLVKVWVYRAQ